MGLLSILKNKPDGLKYHTKCNFIHNENKNGKRKLFLNSLAEFKFKLSKDYIFGFFMIVIIGNAIGFLVLLTRSLWMSILMHILINLTGSVYFNILRLKFRNKN